MTGREAPSPSWKGRDSGSSFVIEPAHSAPQVLTPSAEAPEVCAREIPIRQARRTRLARCPSHGSSGPWPETIDGSHLDRNGDA